VANETADRRFSVSSRHNLPRAKTAPALLILAGAI
jgi:hypothetical protein